jgi:hypothetical protein
MKRRLFFVVLLFFGLNHLLDWGPFNTLVAFGQGGVGISQSFSMAAVAPPPTVTVGNGVSTSTATGATSTSTGGSLAAGTYRICVTFFSSANTETPCSVDTAATSVVTLTGTTSTLTIFPPVSAAGGSNVVGWRPWIGASGGAAGAEGLQTPAATICTLSTSSTPSCSLSSPAVFTSQTFSSGSAPTAYALVSPAIAANVPLFENSQYQSHIISWVVSGTAPTACTFNYQTGATIAALTNVGQTITCTSSGSYAVPVTATSVYSDINVATFTEPANGTAVVTFTEVALPYLLPIYWGPAAPTSACAAPMAAFFLTGASSNLYTCVTTTWTAITLP